MEAKVAAMRLVREITSVKVAEVLYYDTSKTICNGNYFFMEMLDGESYFSVGDSLTEEEKDNINFETGQLYKQLVSITGKQFGMLGDKEHWSDSLYEFVKMLIVNVLEDAKKKDVYIGVTKEEMLPLLLKDKANFEQVSKPILVHWDLWEGNIFVKDKHVSGIIDWERAMWGDPLMEERFRNHSRKAGFLRGYGVEKFTEDEMRRIYWYDVFLYLIMMTEGAYREYEDDSQYQWVKPMFEDAWKKII